MRAQTHAATLSYLAASREGSNNDGKFEEVYHEILRSNSRDATAVHEGNLRLNRLHGNTLVPNKN